MGQHLNRDPELETSVLGDLRQLVKLFGDDLSDHSALVASGILRRLLIEQSLLAYRKQIGSRRLPRVKTLDLKRWLKANYSHIRLATCGNVTLGPVVYGPQVMRFVNVASDPGIFPSQTLTLPTYLDSTGAIAMGRPVKRRILIKYLANTLGGVHFDSARTRKSQGLNHKADQELEMFKALDRAKTPLENEFMIDISGGEEPVRILHAEILAIAQHVLRSPEVLGMLPEKFRMLVPEGALDFDRQMNWSKEPFATFTAEIDFKTGEWKNAKFEENGNETLGGLPAVP